MRITPAIVSLSVVLLAPWAFAQQGWFSPDAPAPSASGSDAPSASESAPAAPNQAPNVPTFTLPTWLAPAASSVVIPLPPLPRGATVHVSIRVTLDPNAPAKPAPSAVPSCEPSEPPVPPAPRPQLVVKPYDPDLYEAESLPPVRQNQHDPDNEAVPREANNLLFFELGGAGLAYSFNYERFLSENFSLRVGFEYLSLGYANPGSTLIPISANFYIPVSQNGRHNIEISAGMTPFTGGDSYNNSGGVYFTGSIGYRYIPRIHGVTTFIGFTPIWDPSGQFLGGYINVLPWFGTSIGAAF